MPGLEALQAHLTAASNAFTAALPTILRILIGLVVLLVVVVFVGLLRLSRPLPSDPSPSQRRGGQSLPGTGGTAPGARDSGGTVGRGSGGRMVSAASVVRTQSKKKAEACLLGPHFARGATILLFGPSGEGKSRWLAEVVWAVVRGIPIFGWQTVRGSVVWVTEETMSVWKGKAAMVLPDGEASWPWWLLLLRDRCPRLFPPTVWVLSLPDMGIEPTDTTDYRELIIERVERECRRVGKVVAVIQDTVMAVCPQVIKDNTAAKTFMRYNAGLAFRRQVANILVHHENDDGKPLGAKMLKGAADFTMHVHRMEGEPEASRLREVDFGKRYEPYPPPKLVVTMRDDGRQERVGQVPVWPPVLQDMPATGPPVETDDDPELIIDEDDDDEEEERSVPAPVLPAADAPARTPSHRGAGGEAGISTPSLAPLALRVLTPPKNRPGPQSSENGHPGPRTIAPTRSEQVSPSLGPTRKPAGPSACTNPATCIQIRSYLMNLPEGVGVTFRELREGTRIANGTLGRHRDHLLADGSLVTTETGGVLVYWLAGRQPLEEPCQAAG